MVARVGLDGAVGALRAGGVVALPTDTVYGVAASLGNLDAVATLFRAKRRPANLALPVLVDSLEQIAGLGVEWGEPASLLGRAFWPGPLTIIVAAPHELAVRIGSVEDSIGLRIPDDDVLRRILARVGPLCVSSANTHGEPPCRSATDVEAAFGDDEIAGVLDDGERSGVVSSVIDLTTDPWRIVRDGALGHDEIARVLGGGPLV